MYKKGSKEVGKVEKVEYARIILREEDFPFFKDLEIAEVLKEEGFNAGIYVLASLKAQTFTTKSGNTEQITDLKNGLREIAQAYKQMAQENTQNLEETLQNNIKKSKVVQLTSK